MEDNEDNKSEETKLREEINVNTKIAHFKIKFNYQLFISFAILLLSLIFSLNKSEPLNNEQPKSPRYWVHDRYNNLESKNNHLKHIHLVLNRIGYTLDTNASDWSLLWSHDYPFNILYDQLWQLKSYQKVNHFPGNGFITNKVHLATTPSKYIPKAFRLPGDKDSFLEYVKDNPRSLFLQKGNEHRNIYLRNVTEIDYSNSETFIQEYIQNPFLVDGHKFDIGIYVVITSVNPLRVYWYKGDILFRYCPAKYYPFNAANLDKYVIRDDYLPTWEVPSLARLYTAMGFGMKDSFDAYVVAQGKDPSIIWTQALDAIREVILKKEHHIVTALQRYASKDNFFEMMRFDLILDENLRVYLLEANMSPNLSSAHYPPNQLLYEQVLYNLYSVTGVATYLRHHQIEDKDKSPAETMISTDKNIAVWSADCSSEECMDKCSSEKRAGCPLCRLCLNSRLKKNFLRAHNEHLHRGDFRRLYPPTMVQGVPSTAVLLDKDQSDNNILQMLWFQGKCNRDVTWCS